MRAIKIHSHVEKDHTLSIKLPEDVAEGPAEVIVLVPDGTGPTGRSVRDFLATLAQRPHTVRSKKGIDRDLELERSSWGP